MISKKNAKKIAYTYAIETLRAKHLKTGDIGMSATQKDVTKCEEQMRSLAEYLEKKLQGRRKTA